MNIPHPEHPKMQLRRDSWQNLNGIWQFEIDNGRSGESRGLPQKGTRLSGEIVVPFCPKSMLSGIGHTDFMYGVWYKRSITVTQGQLRGLVRLHLGAVDYRCRVYINGQLARSHTGGYVSSFDGDGIQQRPPASEGIRGTVFVPL